MYFQLEEKQERLESRQQPAAAAGDPRVAFLDYVRLEALALPPPAWDYFHFEMFGVISRAKHKAAQVV